MQDSKTQSAKTEENKDGSDNLLQEIVAIIILSILLGFTYNAFSTRGIPLIRIAPTKIAAADSELFTPVKPSANPPEQIVGTAKHEKAAEAIQPVKKVPVKPAPLANPAPKNKSVYTVITIDQVKRLLNERRGVFLDARNADEFAEGHIIGSRNIPYLDVFNHFEEITAIPQDTLVVIYCTGPDCELGRELADFMGKMDFKHLYLYDDGWEGWEKAKMPSEGTKAKK
jgi:rhodanese-related sulfurtransferase